MGWGGGLGRRVKILSSPEAKAQATKEAFKSSLLNNGSFDPFSSVPIPSVLLQSLIISYLNDY